MKKFIILLFAVGFSLLLPGVALAATLSLSPSVGTFNKACPFSLSIELDTQDAQSDGTDVILTYDSSRFSINTSGIAPNTSMYPDFPGNNVDEAAGKITISGLSSVNTPFKGKGILASLNFTVKDTAPAGATQIKFEFNPPSTRDSNVVERGTILDVLSSVVNGNYTIGTGVCGASATATPGTVYKPVGAVDAATPSATTPATVYVPVKTLPEGGTPELTFTMAIIGGVLTVLGILGLALL